MEVEYGEQIYSEIYDCVLRAIGRMEKNPTAKPFHEAILTEEILTLSRFERSFSSDFDYRVKNLIVDQSTLEGFLKNALCNFDNISDWLSETIRVSCPDYDVPPFKKKLSDTKVLLAMIDYLVSEKAFHNYPVEIIEFLDEMIGAASQNLIVS